MSFDVTHSKKFEINGVTVYHEIADMGSAFRHRLVIGDQAHDPVGYTGIAVGQTEDGILVCACIPDYWGNTVPEVFVATPAAECDSTRKED